MARIRTLKPEFFHHEGIASQPFAGRLLAIGLLQLADNQGRLRWMPKAIEAHVFPHDPGVDVAALMAGLETIGYARRYSVDGRMFAVVEKFREHQRITGKEAAYQSKIPAPDEGQALDARPGSSGETPDRFPGKHGSAQGTGEQGNRGTGEEEPPKPPTGGKKKSAKRAASTAANRVFDLWADLAGAKPADGTKVKTNNLRRIDRYIKEHSEREIEAVIRHLADDPWWRGKTAKQTTDIYRAGVHKFLNGAEEVASRVNAAMNNPEANGGEWTDCPDDYPTPLQYDVVALRGFNVGRFPSGGWDPSRKQYANGILPWRTFLEAAAKERLSVPGADLYVPEHYRRHLAACPFVVDGLGEVSSVDGKVEWAYTEVLNDIRQERGML